MATRRFDETNIDPRTGRPRAAQAESPRQQAQPQAQVQRAQPQARPADLPDMPTDADFAQQRQAPSLRQRAVSAVTLGANPSLADAGRQLVDSLPAIPGAGLGIFGRTAVGRTAATQREGAREFLRNAPRTRSGTVSAPTGGAGGSHSFMNPATALREMPRGLAYGTRGQVIAGSTAAGAGVGLTTAFGGGDEQAAAAGPGGSEPSTLREIQFDDQNFIRQEGPGAPVRASGFLGQGMTQTDVDQFRERERLQGMRAQGMTPSNLAAQMQPGRAISDRDMALLRHRAGVAESRANWGRGGSGGGGSLGHVVGGRGQRDNTNFLQREVDAELAARGINPADQFRADRQEIGRGMDIEQQRLAQEGQLDQRGLDIDQQDADTRRMQVLFEGQRQGGPPADGVPFSMQEMEEISAGIMGNVQNLMGRRFNSEESGLVKSNFTGFMRRASSTLAQETGMSLDDPRFRNELQPYADLFSAGLAASMASLESAEGSSTLRDAFAREGGRRTRRQRAIFNPDNPEETMNNLLQLVDGLQELETGEGEGNVVRRRFREGASIRYFSGIPEILIKDGQGRTIQAIDAGKIPEEARQTLIRAGNQIRQGHRG